MGRASPAIVWTVQGPSLPHGMGPRGRVRAARRGGEHADAGWPGTRGRLAKSGVCGRAGGEALVSLQQTSQLALGGIVGKAAGFGSRVDSDGLFDAIRPELDNARLPTPFERLRQD